MLTRKTVELKDIDTLDRWIIWVESVETTMSNSIYVAHHTKQRIGQYLFNYLEFMHPVLANTIRGSASDPFNNDMVIPVFLEMVDLLWDLRLSATDK